MPEANPTAPKLFVFPGGIDEDVLAIGGEPVPYARTDCFAALVLEAERRLLELLECESGRLVSYTASGTAAMEAVVSNLVSAEDRVLAIDGGTFGRRWVEMLRLYPHRELVVEQVPFGRDLEYERLERALREGRFQWLFLQHHETSSGVKFDVARLGRTCAETGTLLAVDAISSFLADEFSMARFGIDAAVLSSHKGLCIPPGLGFVALGPRALAHPFQRRNAYLDFTENLRSLERGHPLFTPAVQLYRQLHRRLQRIQEAGRERVIESVRRKALSFRRLLEQDGRTMVAASPSNCLTSFHVDCAARALCGALAERGFHVMPSADPRQIRVAHLGTSTEADHHALYHHIIEIEGQLTGVQP